MFNFFIRKQQTSYKSTNIINPSAPVNDISTDNITGNDANGSTHNWGSYSLSNAMKLRFVLVALSVFIILGITQSGSSRNNNNSAHLSPGLQTVISRIIGGSEVKYTRHFFKSSAFVK